MLVLHSVVVRTGLRHRSIITDFRFVKVIRVMNLNHLNIFLKEMSAVNECNKSQYVLGHEI